VLAEVGVVAVTSMRAQPVVVARGVPLDNANERSKPVAGATEVHVPLENALPATEIAVYVLGRLMLI
jgi:hypothetical protein